MIGLHCSHLATETSDYYADEDYSVSPSLNHLTQLFVSG